jgi:hypothetical protein
MLLLETRFRSCVPVFSFNSPERYEVVAPMRSNRSAHGFAAVPPFLAQSSQLPRYSETFE